MEQEEFNKRVSVWQMIGVIVTFFIGIVGIDFTFDYCVSEASSWLLNIAGVVGVILIVYICYKVINKILT